MIDGIISKEVLNCDYHFISKVMSWYSWTVTEDEVPMFSAHSAGPSATCSHQLPGLGGDVRVLDQTDQRSDGSLNCWFGDHYHVKRL